ncbi:hypothetical protein [Caminibacter sp.]
MKTLKLYAPVVEYKTKEIEIEFPDNLSKEEVVNLLLNYNTGELLYNFDEELKNKRIIAKEINEELRDIEYPELFESDFE